VKAILMLAVLALSPLAACGGGAECGNGNMEEGEQCDDGNEDETDFCRACESFLPPRTVVKWLFNADAAEGFMQDGCSDLRVTDVRIELDGPIQSMLEEECSNRQVVFTDLPPGPYIATMTPLDTNGDSLVTEPVTMQITAGATDSEDTVVVPWDAWIGPYTGSFFFTIRWGGMECSAGSPPVATQVITLSVDGTVVATTTTDGEPLDGSAPFACIPASNPSPIAALLVPFGPATIVISGRDSGGVEAFHGTFDTFVGAGPSNPTLNYDVPTIYDAGPPDADIPPDA
jgi:hypothetical protein